MMYPDMDMLSVRVIIPLESNPAVEIAVLIYGEFIFFFMHPLRWSMPP